MLRLNAMSGVLLVCALGCGSSASKTSTSTTTSSNAPSPEPAAAAATQPPETLPADTPRTTVGGNTFIAPGGWSVATRGSVTLLTPPEPGSTMALVDVEGADADAAVKAAWAAYKPDARWPLQLATDQSDINGWSKRRTYFYQTSPNEKRGVVAVAAFANDRWLVTITDMANDTREKRAAQVALIFDRLFP